LVGQATAQMMEDGRRLHLQHGPIDIVAEAFGAPAETSKAYHQAAAAFETVLATLVQDLGTLRQPIDPDQMPSMGPLSGELWRAAQKFAASQFVTPMAAVAGSVADHVLHAMLEGRTLDKVYVNNGGDIALYLGPDATFKTGIVNDQDNPAINATITLQQSDDVKGLATSGWKGRSLSPGIADAVTVLASNAAIADVAATLIAGAVFTKNPAVTQVPASTVRDDTDLGDMLVTTDVGQLPLTAKKTALQRGLKRAEEYQRNGLIHSAYLAVQGEAVSLLPLCEREQRKIA